MFAEDDGFVVYESHTILRYLATSRKVASHWYPQDLKKRTRIDMYLDWHHTNLRPYDSRLLRCLCFLSD